MKRRIEEALPGTRHTGDENHIFRDLFRAQQAVSSAYTRCIGAPAGRIVLLRMLAVGQGRLGTNELARRLGVDPAAVTRQVKDMEAEGLVTRSAHATDGRRTTVKLTAAGLEVFREIHDRGHAYERELVARVGNKDIEAARRVLQAIRDIVLQSVNLHEEDVP